jgi:hypothetical protein
MPRASSGTLADSVNVATVWFSFCRAEALEIPLGSGWRRSRRKGTTRSPRTFQGTADAAVGVICRLKGDSAPGGRIPSRRHASVDGGRGDRCPVPGALAGEQVEAGLQSLAVQVGEGDPAGAGDKVAVDVVAVAVPPGRARTRAGTERKMLVIPGLPGSACTAGVPAHSDRSISCRQGGGARPAASPGSRSGAAAGDRAAATPGRQAQPGQPSPAAGARPAAARPRPHAAGPRSPRPWQRHCAPAAPARRTPAP